MYVSVCECVVCVCVGVYVRALVQACGRGLCAFLSVRVQGSNLTLGFTNAINGGVQGHYSARAYKKRATDQG